MAQRIPEAAGVNSYVGPSVVVGQNGVYVAQTTELSDGFFGPIVQWHDHAFTTAELVFRGDQNGSGVHLYTHDGKLYIVWARSNDLWRDEVPGFVPLPATAPSLDELTAKVTGCVEMVQQVELKRAKMQAAIDDLKTLRGWVSDLVKHLRTTPKGAS